MAWGPRTLGSLLRPEVQREALASFVHRFTKDHKPAWACKPRPDGTAYPVQFASDADWLSHTIFRTRKDGELDRRHDACESVPTWPDNPELRTLT